MSNFLPEIGGANISANGGNKRGGGGGGEQGSTSHSPSQHSGFLSRSVSNPQFGNM